MLQVLQKSNAANLRAPATKLAQHLGNQFSSLSNPQGLPNLPVPKLNDTLEKYLKSVQPHLPPEKFTKTQDLIKKFGEKGGIGEKLQDLLVKHAEKKDNWLSDWWLENAYLKYRDPVVVFSSPGLVFPKREFSTQDDKLKFTAKMISAALSYKNLIDTNKIPVESIGKFQLDMVQYRKIFGTCRVPGIPGDSLVFHPNSKHIVVIVNEKFFKVPVYGADGNMLSEAQLIDQLQSCIVKGDDHRHQKVGILTSDMRDNWATAYQDLVSNDFNRHALEAIQSSLFTVSIDKEMPQIGDDTITACHQLITGGGSHYNSGNRWYDKTVQFVVGSNGINGLTYEHSPAEGDYLK
jgi:carnitine O-acetyltransferase